MSAAAKVLEEHKPRTALAIAHSRGFAEQNERQRIRERDLVAFKRMCLPIEQGGQRPLKPPPLPANLPLRVSAGAIALRRDKVLGVYEEPRR